MAELSTQWLRSERAALARSRGRRKLDVFLDSRDPQALVRSLPAEDLYFAIQDIGPDDARSLIRLASPEQFRIFVDLDAWKGYELDTEKVLLWLRLARGGEEIAYREKLAAMDLEVLELLIRGIVRIFDLEEEGEPDDEIEGTVERTPEGRFVLIYPSEGADYASARRLIQDLYSEDPFRAARLLYAVRWELESELSESALRWRNARLADLGFPSPQEAASLYARVDLSAELPPPAAPPEEPPGFFLAELESGSLLDRAMGLVPEDARDVLQLQLAAVMNAALVADRVDIGDVEEVRDTARVVRSRLSLALAHLAGDDAAKASSYLTDVALRRLFQIGFTLTLEPSWRAKRLVAELPLRLQGADVFLPESPDGEALAALLGKRPRYHGGLDGPASAPKDRPFSELEEIARASRALDRVEALGGFLRAAGLDPAAAGAMVVEAWDAAGLVRARFGELFLTAVARRVVGLDFAFAALPVEKLADAIRAALQEDGALAPTFRDAAHAEAARIGETSEHVRQAIETALGRLEADLGPQVLTEGADTIESRLAAPFIVAG